MSNLFDNIKILRDRTGISIVECKKALLENNNIIDDAIVYLRKIGTLNAEKRSHKSTTEGVIAIKIDQENKNGIMVELSCETDFVSRSSDFLNYSNIICDFYLSHEFSGKNFFYDRDVILPKYLEDLRLDIILKFKENIIVKRLCKVFTPEEFVFSYLHFDNKIGVMLCVDRYNSELSLDVLVQIASMNPKYLSISDVPDLVVNNERDIFFEKFKNQFSDKTDDLIHKMVDGQISKFFKSNVLLEQSFVKDPKVTIKSFLSNRLHIKSFFRFSISD